MKFLALLFVVSAHADITTDFSYSSAREAFQRGTVPQQAQLIGSWMEVGIVDSEGRYGKHGDYSPDGWIKVVQDHKAKQRTIREFKLLGLDPFGQPHYTSTGLLTDQDTGQVNTKLEDRVMDASVTDVISTAKVSKSTTICGLTEECRILSNDMLLCETRSTGDRYCTTRYLEGYVRAQP